MSNVPSGPSLKPLPSQNASELVKVVKAKSIDEALAEADIEQERKFLQNRVKEMILEEEKSQQKKIYDNLSVQDLRINVSLKENYAGHKFPKSYTYKAKIICLNCNKPQIVTKVGCIGQPGNKWSLSNVRRH